MVQELLWCFGRFALCQIVRASDELMPIGEDLASHERRILELWVNPERQVNALGDLVDNPLCDENLNADIWVGCLKCADQWSKQRVRNTGWRREPQRSGDVRQMVRSDAIHRLTEFGGMLGLLENGRPTSVRRILRVERSSRRTPSSSSRSATRRLTVEVGILRRRAASEKLLASTTLAKIISEFRSVIETFCAFRSWPQNATLHGRGLLKDYPKCGKIICSLAHYSHRPQWDYVRLGKKY